MADYKVDFKALKARVGIDDVAYSLGYRLDRKAGVGRYIELVLGEGRERRDTIIVSRPQDKAKQTFFRRDGSKGDVVTFIRENLNAFVVTGKDDWQKTAKVLARFAMMPEPEYAADREYVRAARSPQVFHPGKYELRPLDADNPPALFAQRGLTAETVKAFAPFITLIRDKENTRFDGFNIGFPYTDGQHEDVRGYEIRGYGGHKAKAAGTDSSTSAWMADLATGHGGTVRSVFFCESALDAMAFYQHKHLQLGTDIALVSLGGTFSDGQVRGVLNRFPMARPFDCFDNDLAGHIYGLRLMALVEDLPLKVSKKGDGLQVSMGDRSFEPDMTRSLTAQVSDHFSIRYRMGTWQPPKAFKDWNDCVLNRPMTPVMTARKDEREQNLAGRRAGIK